MELTKICTKCGIEKPATTDYFTKEKRGKYGLRSNCKECVAVYTKANKDKNLQYQKEYNKSHVEHIAQHKKEYNTSHVEAIAQHKKEYNTSHVEAITQQKKEWAKANPDKCNAINQRRRARKAGLPATFTVQQWESCKEHFNHTCAYCGRQEPLQQEHYIAVTRSGSYAADNVICACKSCNSSKGGKLLNNWYPKQKFYAKKRERAIIDYLNSEHSGTQISFNVEAIII